MNKIVLLVAINAKYVHTNLALRYLKNAIGEDACMVKEYTVNQMVHNIAMDIFQTGCKTILFSCYIWNIEMVYQICDILKKADSSIFIALGGPEVSYLPETVFDRCPQVDTVLCGEGEHIIQSFLKSKKKERIVYGKDIQNLDDLPFPYTKEELSSLQGRLIYYETSRGCPYRCGFCLSCMTQGVRFRSLDKVKEDLNMFFDSNIKLVKLVDRTFNANNQRALEIVEYIKENSKDTSFHFEIKAESVSDALIKSLQEARHGLFQLEIGVQSTNVETLAKINRKADFAKLSDVVQRLRKNNNIHLHLDLIAGLPGEDLASFQKSFNDVYQLNPHDLQLGFLKHLKGAQLDVTGCAFSDFPPYEVVHSDVLSYEEISFLKGVEDVLEKYYNSGGFSKTLDYLISKYATENPFSFYEGLATYFKEQGLFGQNISRKSLYEILYHYVDSVLTDTCAKDDIIYDYCTFYKDNLSFMSHDETLKEKAFEFLKDEQMIASYLPEFNKEKPATIYKKVRFASIGGEYYLFDYEHRKTHCVTSEILKK